VAEVGLGHVGLVLGLEVSRLAACRREANANTSVMVDCVHEKNIQNCRL
jgi:hypothetical protein